MSQISIIVPVYNAEKTIIKCLNSISAQTYGDFEVLLINDGSKDTSAEICKQFCEKDARFKLINQENAGPSAARNRGIDEADSKYLAFVDSDDYIEPDMLCKMYTAAERANADITVCGWYVEKNGIRNASCLNYKPGVYRKEELRKIAVEAIDVGMPGNIPPYSWVRLVRRECMENPRLRFNTKIYRSEDYLLWNKLFFRIDCLCLITDKALYHYIENSSSITHSYVKNYWDMGKTIYNELADALPKEKTVTQHLNFMFMRRAYIAMGIATKADSRTTFKEDLRKILRDTELMRAVDAIPVITGVRKQKIRYMLFKFRLQPIIAFLYYNRYRKSQKTKLNH